MLEGSRSIGSIGRSLDHSPVDAARNASLPTAIAGECRFMPAVDRALIERGLCDKQPKIGHTRSNQWSNDRDAAEHLERLRVDLLQVWAASCFDVDAYARIRHRIRLLIDTARKARDPPSCVVARPPGG